MEAETEADVADDTESIDREDEGYIEAINKLDGLQLK